MNELLAALILAVVQGITEWLPVSSSGHLVLTEHLLSYDGGLLFEVALHLGTLMAVFVYFGKDIVDITREVLSLRFHTEQGREGVLIALASVPVAIVGFVFLPFFEQVFANLTVTALGFAITGALLLITSLEREEGRKRLPTVLGAVLIGLAQMVAIMPGISRAGATLSAGVLYGMNVKSAARFSFLMAVPAVLGANLVVIGNQHLPPEMIWAILLSFAVGLAVIHFMFRVVLTSRKNLQWFGFYALVLAAVLGAYEVVA